MKPEQKRVIDLLGLVSDLTIAVKQRDYNYGDFLVAKIKPLLKDIWKDNDLDDTTIVA